MENIIDKFQKKFNGFVLFSTLSKNLIEVFIPLLLYKFGFSVKEVILYYLFVNVFGTFLVYLFVTLGNKFGYKKLAYLSIFNFALMQIVLNFKVHTVWYLVLLALVYTLYFRTYWISRRYFNLHVVKKDNIAKTYSIISIFNQLGTMTATFIGGLLLDTLGNMIVSIISIIIFVISVIFLNGMEEKFNRNKIEVIKTFKIIPKRDTYIIACYELLNILYFFIALYIYIYIKNSFQLVGALNLLTGIATIIFTYLYGKFINKERNFLKLSFVIMLLILCLEINTTGIIFAIAIFLEGFAKKMIDVSINKEVYKLSKKIDYENYNLYYELVEHISKVIVLLPLLLFINNFKVMIYLVLTLFVSAIIFNFIIPDIDDYNNDIKKD
ncbi:MAG: MFS transporter [Clostridia bacterium]|nr:MFS transporter [Clostridia bacterium]